MPRRSKIVNFTNDFNDFPTRAKYAGLQKVLDIHPTYYHMYI